MDVAPICKVTGTTVVETGNVVQIQKASFSPLHTVFVVTFAVNTNSPAVIAADVILIIFLIIFFPFQ
jgi:hypothetical protein